MGRARGRGCAHSARRARRLGFEPLEGRCLPTLGFRTVLGIGASGQYAALNANAEAEDSAGDVVVVGSIMGSAPFNSGGGAAVTLSSTGNQDAYIAEFSSTGALIWAETFPGQATSAVGQASAVAVDSSGNIEVVGSFSGTIKVGSTTLSAPSRTDVFVAELSASGQVQWAVQTTGATNKVDTANAIAPDGSGGAYIAGSLMGSMTAGSTVLTAVGATEAYAAHVSSTGQFSWAVSTTGSSGSVAGIDGLAVDATGRLVMSGYYAGTVNFNPSGSTTLTAAGSYDVAVWVLNSSGGLAWAQGFGGSNYDQADAVAVDSSGNIYVTGAFSGTVNFNPSGTALNLTAGNGGYNPFVLKLSSAGSTVWADALVDSSSVAIGNGLGVDSSGRVIVGGWFAGAVDFDPGAGTAPVGSSGDEDVFVLALDGSGNFVGVVTGGGSGTDTSFGLALNAAGAIAIAGVYTGPNANIPSIRTAFGSTTLPTIGKSDIFVATLALSGGSASLSAPNPPALEAASDSGSSQSDGSTNVTAPTFDISGDSGGLTVQLLRDGAVVASRVGNGPITDPGLVPDGVHQYTAREDDSSDNVGPASAATQVTIDTAPPATPPAPALLVADDSGAVGDGTTNVNTPRLTGSAEAGTTINLWIAGVVVASGTAAGGSYTILLTSALADGTYSVTATATDAAGNVSAASPPFVLTIDTTPPAAPSAPALLTADDSGAPGDGITNVNTPHLTGTAEAGSTVSLWISGIVVASGTATGGAYTIQLVSALADGTYSVTATATDAAGNVSASSEAFSLTIDTTAPAAPSAPTLLAADDSGTVGDGITNVSRPRLTGAAEAGSTVMLLIAGAVVGTGTAVGGAYTIQLTSALADGTYSVTATATDAAGNTSLASVPFVLTIDTTAPAAPAVPSLQAADDSGTVGDGITNVSRPRLTGAAEAGATVNLTIAGSVVGTGVATGGIYTVQLISALADGTYSVTATATDAAGITSPASAVFSLRIDTTPPATPPTPGLLAADDSGTVGDGITNVSRPRIAGTAEAGATVRLSIAGAVVGTGTTTGGSYTIQITAALADGTYSVTATATDAAGNDSASSAAFSLTIDTTAPAAPPAPVLLAADDSGTVGDGITNVTRPRITGATEAGSAVTLWLGGAVAGTGVATGGIYTIQLSAALPDGTYTITATATDAAGNTSAMGAAFSLRIDTTPPTAPPSPGLLAADDSGTAGDGITNVSRPRLTGAAEAGATVNLTIGGSVVGAGVATGGVYTILINSPLADGAYSVTATATDAAGNVSAAGGTFSLTIDTTAPAVPTLGLYAADDTGTIGDGITGVKRPRFTGSAEAGATVKLTVAGSVVGTGVASGSTFTILLVSALADGTYPVTATATDAAGNVGAPSSPFSLTIDTTPPAAPAAPGLLVSDDSGAVGDGITNVSRPRLTGAAEAGATVTLFFAGAVVGTGTATGGTYTIQLGASLVDGTYAVTATATDAAGNVSPASQAFALTIDTLIPPAPTLAILAADRAVVMSDGATQDHHIRVSGLASPGSYVQLLDTAGDVVAGAMASSPGGAYTITTPTVPVGAFTYRTRVEDVAGNIGPMSPPVTIQVLATQGDYFGNGYADLITYDAFHQVWSILSPTTGATTQVSFGLPNAVPVPADYSGDGMTDLAVFQPSTGVWLIRNSADGTVSRYTFGGPGDIPVPSDYSGVGHAEVAVYRPSTAMWFVSNQATGLGSVWTFGFPGQSIPVPADYDGLGATDLGVYVPATGGWYIRNTTSGAVSHTVFGGVGFKPVPADYDGVGRADIALYAPATSQWLILSATTGTERVITYGGAYVDVPVPGDYNGDGTADLAVYWTVGSQFGLDLSQSGAKQTLALGTPVLDEPGVVPGSYLVTEVALAWNVTPPVIPPLPLPQPQPAARTIPASPPPAPSPSVAPAAVAALAPSTPKGTPVTQAIKPKAGTGS